MVASWACEVTEIITQRSANIRKPLLCEGYGDHTGPSSNQIPDVHIAVSVVYDTF